MSRKPRVQIADVVYHVGSRGVEKRQIFGIVRGDRDYFVSLFARTVRRHGWRCHYYCVMGNHFHLGVETPDANIADGMRYLKSGYARWFNEQTDREGALFERRYFGELVDNEAHAYELARYIVLNPVRAKLCAHPREWPWSSYAAAVGSITPPPFLYLDGLSTLFGEGPQGIARYERFVEDGIAIHALAQAADRNGHDRGLTPMVTRGGAEIVRGGHDPGQTPVMSGAATPLGRRSRDTSGLRLLP